MKIIVLNSQTQHLLLEFTLEETQHPLFSMAISKIRNQDELEVHKTGELVSVQAIDMDSYETTGILVDDIRQVFMGDIGGPTADLTNCPQFGFTPEPEPEVEELDPKVEIVPEVDPEIIN